MATDDIDLALEGIAAKIQELVERKSLQLDVSHALAGVQAVRARFAQKPRLPVAPPPVGSPAAQDGELPGQLAGIKKIPVPSLAQVLAKERAGEFPSRDLAATLSATTPLATKEAPAERAPAPAPSPMAAAAPGLPTRWAAAVDPNSGHTYHYNTGKGKTQWEWSDTASAPRSRSPRRSRLSRWGAPGTAMPGPEPAEQNHNTFADLAIQLHAAPPGHH
ncbi:unnamed protein product [Prorocentrum cordatum]|uniref:WW domain-containing protein n=1 Tax=Prorocentrum cordatum TaxID=2364126 RepID=A0ABN9T781_9DINO|nr:unnamed protein product [Polarella glacialis]